MPGIGNGGRARSRNRFREFFIDAPMDLHGLLARDHEYGYSQSTQTAWRQFRVRILAARHHPEKSRVLHDAEPGFGRELVKPAWACEPVDKEAHGRLVIAGGESISCRFIDLLHEISVELAAIREMFRQRQDGWLGQH